MTTPKTENDAYDWYADRYQSIYVSRNRWFVAAGAALTLAALQALALVCLLPLKTSVPFLIKEETSGTVTTLTRLNGDDAVTYSEAVRKYFLARYIIARETYDSVDLAENYRAVDLMSGETERRIFKDAITSSNPASPLVVYGASGRRLTRIKSIVFLNSSTAQIRFSATVQRSSSLPSPSEWIATVAFKFGSVPGGEAERLVNPLGFCVTHYRIDQEVVVP
jgi:type IV secretion system protein VirB8